MTPISPIGVTFSSYDRTVPKRHAQSLLLTPRLLAEDEPGGNEATIKSLARGGSVFEGDLCGDDV